MRNAQLCRRKSTVRLNSLASDFFVFDLSGITGQITDAIFESRCIRAVRICKLGSGVRDLYGVFDVLNGISLS